MVFTTEATVNYYDCDVCNRLKMSAALKYMQQTSSEHLTSLGFPVERLFGQHLVFLLTKMCVRVHRMPAAGDKLRIGTAPLQPKGVRFYREFVVDGADSERLLSALSTWVLVDPADHRVLRPSAFPYPIAFQEASLVGVVEDWALPKVADAGEACGEIPVRYTLLDVNNHVTNTSYADFVCDLLPYEALTGRGIARLVLSFQNEAVLGDTIALRRTELEDGSYYIAGTHGGTACFEALAALNRE